MDVLALSASVLVHLAVARVAQQPHGVFDVLRAVVVKLKAFTARVQRLPTAALTPGTAGLDDLRAQLVLSAAVTVR
jgi:hypothetical protein